MESTPAPRFALRWWQWSLLGLALAAAALAAALALAWPHLQARLLGLIAARTGRQIEVRGAFETHLLSLHPRLTVRAVSVGNPPWSPPGAFAEIAALTLDFDWQLGAPLLQLRGITMEHAVLHLLRAADGKANWQLHEGGTGRGPEHLRRLVVPDAQVDLRDERHHLQFRGVVSAADARIASGAAPLQIQGSGQLNGRPATFSLQGDPLQQVRPGQPYHFSLEERSGATHLSGHGALDQAFDFRYLEGDFSATGPDLKDLYFLVGIHLPDTAAFELSGRLTRKLGLFVYSDLHINCGKSDLGGTLRVATGAGPPRIEAELSSDLLRLADIGARAAGREPEPAPTAGLRIPDTPLPLAGIRRGDARVSFRARNLAVGTRTFSPASAVISFDHGVLSIENLTAGLAAGTISGSARLDARREQAHGELTLLAKAIELDRLRGASGREPPLGGTLSARTQLTGTGTSLHALAASASGALTAVIPHGVMRASLAEFTSLDVTGALGVAMRHGGETAIRCGVASFVAHDGVANVQSLVLDTDAALVTGGGSIHLDSETLDLTLRGRPKRPALVLRSAVAIRGTLAHPQIGLSGHEVLAQAGAAIALGAVLTPLAAVLAFVNPDLAHDADCASLLAQARAPGAAAAPAAAAPKPAGAQ